MSVKYMIFGLLLLAVHQCNAQTTEDVLTTENGTLTTTIAQNTTTTTAPNTTTTIAPSTTPGQNGGLIPVTDPNSEAAQGTWNVTDDKVQCICSKMGVRLGFTYTTPNNETKTIAYDIPANNSKASGLCNATTQDLVISFPADDSWKYSLQFVSKDKQWSVESFQVNFKANDQLFPGYGKNVEVSALYNASAQYQTTNGSSFQCVSKNPLTGFVVSDEDFVLNVTTYKLQVEAFRNSAPNTTAFSPPVPCPADTEVSNIVPIAVGAALAGLVVIVLIAYLIGRKKNKRGYESV